MAMLPMGLQHHMATDRLPIFIVDDNDAVRDSLRMVLQSAGHAVVTFRSASFFLSDSDMQGGCLIVDIRMPGMSGLELQDELARRKVDLPIIVMTGHGDVPLAVRAMQAGAVDFIEKPFDDQRMLDSVALALQVGQRTQSRAAEVKAARDLISTLTTREREVMNEVVKGGPNKAVAFTLGISPRTVEIHRARVMEKLQARNVSELVRISLAGAAQD